ncbi:MAG TPA: CdaR family protein [Anaerolineales bacterium]|nr:CdaR family protein [Anaerolineales bacterium]
MRMFAKNLRTFLLSLVLGVSVWVSAVSAANPNEVGTFPRPIPIEVVGQDPSLVLTSEIPSTMQLTLRAPRSVWDALTANEDSVQATLDLSGLSAGEHSQEIQIAVAARPYQIVLANPSAVPVVLESISSQTFPLSLSLTGQPAAGYQVGEATMELTEVTVSGPESLVLQATRARVLVSLDGVRESIEESIPIQILNAQNEVLQGLTINPEAVQVNIPISQQGGFRDVAVKVVVQGQQAAGYRIENISVFPPVITVFASDPELVSELPGVVETQPLSLDDRKEDISTRLSLNLPENITVVGAQTVQVQVSISPIQTSVTLSNQPISVNGLEEGLAAQVFPETVDVIVSGPLPVLDTLVSQEDIVVSVDASGLEIGTYQLTPEVRALVDNVLVESILPGTVEVVISPPVTPTITPFPTP